MQNTSFLRKSNTNSCFSY